MGFKSLCLLGEFIESRAQFFVIDRQFFSKVLPFAECYGNWGLLRFWWIFSARPQFDLIALAFTVCNCHRFSLSDHWVWKQIFVCKHLGLRLEISSERWLTFALFFYRLLLACKAEWKLFLLSLVLGLWLIYQCLKVGPKSKVALW